MKIAVNTRLLIHNKLDGIGWYSHEILKRMVLNNPKVEFLFLFDRKFDQRFIYAKNVTPIVIGPQARHPILFKWWFNKSVKSVLKKHEPDVFFSPDGYLSLTVNTNQIGTIHDLNFEHRPEDLRKSHAKFYRKYFPLFARKAKRIITVSEFSKNDIIQFYNISSSKISVVYNGVNNEYRPIPAEAQFDIKKKFSGGADFFLSVGSIHPRKNVIGCIKAFNDFKNETKAKHKLIFAGNKYGWNAKMETALNESKFVDDIIFTDRIDQADLSLLMGAASALLYLSHFEGFGMPILEAFKAETPVICGNNSSLPEVAGNAGFIVDENNAEEISNAMQKATNEDIRKKKIAEGLSQAEKFSWDKAAIETWKIIEDVASLPK